MKKPKIGDIVHYFHPDKIILAALVLKSYPDNDCDVCVINLTGDTWTRHVHYSQYYKNEHWSWPESQNERSEEEKLKECEHDSYLEYRENHKPNTYKCMKCGIDFDKEKPQSKAEELIEKIWVLLDEDYKSRDEIYRDIMGIYNLIKEYKGIK